MAGSLSGKTILVTGGTGLFGKKVTSQLGEDYLTELEASCLFGKKITSQ